MVSMMHHVKVGKTLIPLRVACAVPQLWHSIKTVCASLRGCHLSGSRLPTKNGPLQAAVPRTRYRAYQSLNHSLIASPIDHSPGSLSFGIALFAPE